MTLSGGRGGSKVTMTLIFPKIVWKCPLTSTDLHGFTFLTTPLKLEGGGVIFKAFLFGVYIHTPQHQRLLWQGTLDWTRLVATISNFLLGFSESKVWNKGNAWKRVYRMVTELKMPQWKWQSVTVYHRPECDWMVHSSDVQYVSLTITQKCCPIREQKDTFSHQMPGCHGNCCPSSIVWLHTVSFVILVYNYYHIATDFWLP